MPDRPARLRRYAALAALVAIAGLSIARLARAPFSQNILDLLPLKDRVIGKQYAFLSAIDAMGTVIVDITHGDGESEFGPLAEAAGEITGLLEKSGLFVPADAPSPADFLELQRLLVRYWPALFTADDSLWLAARLNQDSLAARFDLTCASLFTFSDQAADGRGACGDPFGFSSFILRRLAAFRPADDVRFHEGFITNEANDRILLVLKARGSLDPDTTMRIERVMNRAASLARDHGCEFTWMGAARAACDNSRTIRQDINRTAPLTVIGIALLCVFVYRRRYYGLLIFIPTLLGMAAALALVSFAGKLSVISLGFGAALLGITVDYAVHYFFHIDNSPADPNPVRTLAPAIIASALTTAGAFAALLFARIPGLSQLALVTAAGIMLVALFTMTILPPLFPPRSSGGRHRRLPLSDIFSKLYGRSIDLVLTPPLLVAAAMLWFFAPRVPFDGNPDRLNAMSEEALRAEQTFETRWPGIAGGTYLVVSDSSAGEALAAAEQRLVPLVETLVAGGYIGPAEVFTGILPSQSRQEENRRRWRRTWTPEAIAAAEAAVRTVAEGYGIESGPFAPYLASLSGTDSLPPLTTGSFPVSFIKNIASSYFTMRDRVWYAAVPVTPRSPAAWERIASAAASAGVMPVNDAALGERLVAIIRDGFLACGVYIPLIMVVVLFLVFRSPLLVLAGMFPPVMATGITLGIMSLASIPLTIVSLMILAFIFGLGIDYAVFILHVAGKQNAATPAATVAGAAASVTVAALTTAAGLGAMIFARHPALSTLGTTGLLGIVSSYLCAVIFIPAIMRIRKR